MIAVMVVSVVIEQNIVVRTQEQRVLPIQTGWLHVDQRRIENILLEIGFARCGHCLGNGLVLDE